MRNCDILRGTEMKKWLYLVLFVILVIVISFVFISNISKTSRDHAEAFFTIDGSLVDKVVQFIDSSQHFLYVSALDVSHPIILKTLSDALNRGIDVKVLTENPVVELPSKMDISKGLHHVKFMVNENGVVFGSANFSESGLETGLNNIIFFSNEYSERFKKFFLNAWEYGKITTTDGFLVSPIDNVEESVVKLILKADKRIYVCIYALTDANLVSALKFKESKGVDVRILTDKWFRSSPLYKVSTRNIKVVESRMLHHKFILADGTLITGSTNYTESGFHKNVEMIYITRDKQLVKEYERVFSEIENSVF